MDATIDANTETADQIHRVTSFPVPMKPRCGEWKKAYSGTCIEVLGINDIFQPSNSVMYGKEPRYNKTSIYRTNFPSPMALR